ncbi:MAG: beta-phosphoglucomutase [Clostridiaceae bacterium]|nr:beta-phosphoglucomutase [Clostridiaceae bacterium]
MDIKHNELIEKVRRLIEAVIFDLDGVIVSTDEYHYQAWQKLADDENIYFDRVINERLRGVGRMGCLEIILERATRDYTTEEKKELADRKNKYYRESLDKLSPADILPGVMEWLQTLKTKKIPAAIGSSSKNTGIILDRIELTDCFNVIISGNDVKKSKPDPEIFLLAAERLKVDPCRCLVVEDAVSGVEAGIAAGMKVLAVGYAREDKRAHMSAADLSKISFDELIQKEQKTKLKSNPD